MEAGYFKADSRNLPRVDDFMIHAFYKNNPNFVSAEIKNIKTQRAGREKYGDEAIGFVQVHRHNQTCTVKAKVTLEHRVRDKGYDVTFVVDEESEEIISCECSGCTASLGGCKHGVALLFWMCRRSQEPSSTSVECYWRSSSLSKVGKTLKAMSLKEMYECPVLPGRDKSVLERIIQEGRAASSKSVLPKQFCEEDVIERISIHTLMTKYLKAEELVGGVPNATDFLSFATENLSESDCKSVIKITESQSKNSKWYEARYCRITASKLYEVAKCKTFGGSLVEKMFGASTVPQTDEMVRGLNLEDKVLAEIRGKLNINVKKCGMVIRPEFPLFGASPDAISDKYSTEIKCPSKEKTIKNYIADGKIANKFLAQIQLQMFLLQKTEGLFCVASPNFEQNREVIIKEVQYDEDLCKNLMNDAESFWKNGIFPKLI